MIWLAGGTTMLAGVFTAVILIANGSKTSGEFIGRNFIALMWMVVCVLWLIATWPAHARDLGQWEDSDPVVRQWYKSLMQPDNPTMSCCGEADAYWCDDYYARDGQAFCKITDDRDDGPLDRPHIPVGTEIEIPPYKLKHDAGNPSGHSIVFVSRSLYVYCFVQNGGV